MTKNGLVVAAFDFDGTITYRDSLFPFLMATYGRWCTLSGLGYLTPYLATDYLRGVGRQEMKERVLSHFLAGRTYEQVRKEGGNFAQCVLPGLVRPEALSRIRWHQRRGDRCVLISASIQPYIEPWAIDQGFDDILCSQVDVNHDGKLTGKLKGNNCRAEEKVRRLIACVGNKTQYTLYAYGDSRGDRELLALADHPYYREMPDE